jgi:hypothetical protein
LTGYSNLRKLESTGSVSGRITRRSILSGELEMEVMAFTVVNLRISFFSLSRNIGRQLGNSACKLSPKGLEFIGRQLGNSACKLSPEGLEFKGRQLGNSACKLSPKGLKFSIENKTGLVYLCFKTEGFVYLISILKPF